MDSKKIRILFLSHEFSIGGSTVSLISLIQGLKEYDNLEVVVFLPYRKNGTAKRILGKNNINYEQGLYRRNYKKISEKNFIKLLVYDLLNVLATIKIGYCLKKEKIDIVCSNSTGVDVGARAARLAKVPHIYYVREFMERDFKCEYRNKYRMKKLLEKSEYAIFISKAVEEYYKSKYCLQNTSQFYNGFVVEDYYIQGHDILADKKIRFIQVGEFSEGKGVFNTIELLQHLNEAGIRNWRMEFVGKGPEDNIHQMQHLISQYHMESQITIGNFCLDMKEKLSEKDILIMNSRAEGFGRVTVEGMLAGCLVIGRNSGGTKEIIENQVNGILFEDEKDFISIIKQIENQRNVYRQLAKDGQKYALEEFDCTKTARNFMKVVEKCMQQRNESYE